MSTSRLPKNSRKIRPACALALPLAAVLLLLGPASRADERTDKVDALFAQCDKPDSPGSAIGIIKDGKLIYARGYGSANLDYNIPLSTNSVFHIASTSKQFTAACIALLAQEGKLSLDDDVRKYIPELTKYDHTITIRHLIHHTGGLREFFSVMKMAGWDVEDAVTNEHILPLICRQKGLQFRPGDKIQYSNTGYFLLAEIVKRASGKSLRQYADAKIFQPLGMHNTHFHDDRRSIVPNRVIGYQPNKDGFEIRHYFNAVGVGPGGLWTTVEDLFLWDQNFYHTKVGGKALVNLLHQRGKLNDNTAHDYAFGLLIEEYKGLKTVRHGGSFAGFAAELLRFPYQKFSVICLVNVLDLNIWPLSLCEKIADIYLADELDELAPEESRDGVTAKVDPSVYDDYVGKYVSDYGVIWTVIKEGGRLIIEFRAGWGGWDFKKELLPQSDTTFAVKGWGQRISFEPEKAGQPKRIRWGRRNFGVKEEEFAVWFEPITQSADQLREYVGEYYSEELQTTYSIAVQNGRLIARHRRNGDIPLIPTVADRYSARPPVFRQVHFTRDNNRRVTGFNMTAGRKAVDVRFEKQL